MARTRSTASASANIWPGFVDALATLLLVIIFLLVLFVLAQVLLTQAISGKDEALDRLNRQVNELADLLDLERQANANLRLNIAQLSSSLQTTVAARDELQVAMRQMLARAEQAEQALAAAQSKISANRETMERRLLEMESLRRDIQALRTLRGKLETQVAELAGQLQASKERAAELADEVKAGKTRITELSDEVQASKSRITELSDEVRAQLARIGALRDRGKQLEAELASEKERTLLAQREIERRKIELSELLDLYTRLEEDYKAEQQLSKGQISRVGLLNQQVLLLRREIERLNAALEAAELGDQESQAVIVDLQKKLNRALISKVEELARYRSDFFGRLREVLGQRRGIRIVGDRFVFQSEVLFGSGSASLESEGQSQIGRLAATLIDIARDIPPEIDWVLRVDGHTDMVPINTPQFPSNWELSAARAISVVKYLIEQGVPASRLAATGFGEYQPIDPRPGEIGNRRNRRIEFKLTQR
ncbi:MAG: peptidoglycan -binding protein [Alphaproteobacteria bacterium]|jgi:chemotaxis protein MotB|nr:peptidoglycan -binding protein [Alphaproteobacteria bacterium]MDP6566111.1 peptidoglycan -binding protein [Alphaproteobacteria bacterium]MDP6813769.1 peptidoglycan -binding protein [Alphaproteobacteria bacterium]